MAVPSGAVFEHEIAEGVAIWNVSHLLAVHPRRKYPIRSAEIGKLYTHHSGALGKPGFGGVESSCSYVVSKRKFPGFAYTFWLAYEPDLDSSDRLVIYRGNLDETRSWHTGGAANDHGVAVCWQGNLTKTEPSAEQLIMAEAFYTWAATRYDLDVPDGFGMHRELDQWNRKGKPTCPGDHVARWVKTWREEHAS